MRTLFLCTEIAGYFANCIQQYRDLTNAEMLVVFIPNGPQAPFEVSLNKIDQINKREITAAGLEKTCLEFKPDLVYVGGWIDRDYLRICRKIKSSGIPIVCGLDNIWTGSFRQWMAAIFSGQLIKPYFTHIWAAGQQQYQFARRLGFSYDRILTGMYAADVEKFESMLHVDPQPYLLYVGRFETIKGVLLLYSVFNELTTEQRKGWKLKMVGNGSLRSQLIPNSDIAIFDFLQPDKLIAFAADAGGFILPSEHEPWGVVVQEFAAGGKPLILSTAVNAAQDYLIHGFNGFTFRNNDSNDLKATLIRFFALNNDERKRMGERSNILARRGEPAYWVAKLTSIKEPSI